jgi:beta-xylosidase
MDIVIANPKTNPSAAQAVAMTMSRHWIFRFLSRRNTEGSTANTNTNIAYVKWGERWLGAASQSISTNAQAPKAPETPPKVASNRRLIIGISNRRI